MKPLTVLFALILIRMLAKRQSPVAKENGPKHPEKEREGHHNTQLSATVNEQISAPLRDLSSRIASFADDTNAHNKKTERNQEKYQKSSLWWVRATAFSTILFSFLSFILACLTIWILHNQLNAMHRDQRAWINISAPEPSIIFAEGQPLTAKIITVNVGKTPAHRIRREFIIDKLSKEQAPQFDYSRPHMINEEGIMMPNVPYDLNVMMRSRKSVAEPPTLTKSDIDDLRTGKAYIVIFGRTTYLDVHGVSHWAHFCSWHVFAVGIYPTRQCAEYNDIDRN